MLISLFIHFITEIRKYREFGLNNNLAERRIGRWSYLVCYVLLLLFVCFYRCLHVPFRCFITSFCVSEIVSVTFSSHSYLSICLLFTFSQHKSVVGWSSFLSDLQIFNYIYKDHLSVPTDMSRQMGESHRRFLQTMMVSGVIDEQAAKALYQYCCETHHSK